MKNIICFIIGLIIGCAGTFFYFNYNINKQSTEEIDRDIATYNSKITELNNEINKYQGGLIKVILELQKEIYAETVASLESKKAQFSHWINFNYNFAPAVEIPLGEIKSFDDEIVKLKAEIRVDENESAKYAPCLVKSLIDARIAQKSLQVTALERGRIAKMYNLPMLKFPNDQEPKAQEPTVIQNPEHDKESL